MKSIHDIATAVAARVVRAHKARTEAPELRAEAEASLAQIFEKEPHLAVLRKSTEE